MVVKILLILCRKNTLKYHPGGIDRRFLDNALHTILEVRPQPEAESRPKRRVQHGGMRHNTLHDRVTAT